MKRYRVFFLVVFCLSLVQPIFAQTSTATSALPRLVRFGGTVKDLNGSPLTGVAGITFALYSEQNGGAPLWMETQNVTADSNGHYTALLGSTKSEGLPAELFNSEQARWVGVQVEGQAEQPRVLLVSAPYALKAGDAETIGGLPPSAFVLAAPPATGPTASSSAAAIAAGSRDVGPATATDVTTTGGAANYLPLFTGASTILESVVYQTGTGSTAKIGINTSAPTTTLDVKGNVATSGAITTGSGSSFAGLTLPAQSPATSSEGQVSHSFNLTASSYDSTTSVALNQNFKWQAEPVGNDTGSPSASLNLLFNSGTSSPTETGLKLSSNGQITFAAGQTFPGAGAGTVNPLQVALLKWFPAYQSATFSVGISPFDLAFDGANIWVSNYGTNTVTELQAATGAVVGTYAVDGPSGVAFDGANIWVTNEASNTVSEMQAGTGAPVGTFPVGSTPTAVAFDGANIWVTNLSSNTVTKLLAATGAVVGTYAVGIGPVGVAFDGANIWVANAGSDNVTKLLAATGALLGTFAVGSEPTRVAFDGANIWVTNAGSNSVTKLLAATGAVVGTFAVGSNPSGVAFDGANIWVANAGSNSVTKLLAATGALVGTFAVGSNPRGVAFDGTNIWVANAGSNTVSKL